MNEEKENKINNQKIHNESSTDEKNQKKPKNKISAKNLRKSATVRSNDMPDILNPNNLELFKDEKLLNIRKDKRMSQIQKNIDKPDTLFGLNEYKQPKKGKTSFHSIKKLRNTQSSMDLPDTLEPLKEDSNYLLPRPDSMTNIRKSKKGKEKEKQTNNIKLQKKPSIKEDENNLKEIKEIK